MATADKNLSEHSQRNIHNMEDYVVAIVVSEWNEEVTNALLEGAHQTLLEQGVQKKHIMVKYVPGSFELPLAAQWMGQRKDVDAVICLGCVIQGETRHFDFICDAVANGITTVGLKLNKPIVFGVLTTDTKQQALDRAGGKHGNKGDEAAITAVKMLGMQIIGE